MPARRLEGPEHRAERDHHREGAERESLGTRHTSEDKRKMAHVTGMLALNQTAEERAAQLMRVGWIGGRDVAWGAGDQVVCLQHLCGCTPHVDGYWWPRQQGAEGGEKKTS